VAIEMHLLGDWRLSVLIHVPRMLEVNRDAFGQIVTHKHGQIID